MLEILLNRSGEDLFSTIAAFGDAEQLADFDIVQGQSEARESIDRVIDNALKSAGDPGMRILAIKGYTGTGKSHVLTTSFRRAALRAQGEVYPAVLQLTAPVTPEAYDVWVLDALFRQLCAGHFQDEDGRGPLRRLADKLLERIAVEEQDEFLRLIEDHEDDGEIPLAKRLGVKLHKIAQSQLKESPPRSSFFGLILLAGYDDESAVEFLRYGRIDTRLEPLGVVPPRSATDRIAIVQDLGLVARLEGAALAIGFDQVENTFRLGGEGLFAHAVTQAVRLVEQVPNLAIVIASLSDAYDFIVSGGSEHRVLTGDVDRLEAVAPTPVSLERAKPAFLEAVVARRLSLLRSRLRLPESDDPLDPLPDWFRRRIGQARSVRMALHDLSRLRDETIKSGRLPEESTFDGTGPDRPAAVLDFEKLWADTLDTASQAMPKLWPKDRAKLLAWWCEHASSEQSGGEAASARVRTLADQFETPVIEIGIVADTTLIERRELAICEAPNQKHRLAGQLMSFLEATTAARPFALRTKGFPKGRTTQPAGALRKLRELGGSVLSVNSTGWQFLYLAREFAGKYESEAGYLDWRREKQWLLNLVPGLDRLVERPEPLAATAEEEEEEKDAQISPPVSLDKPEDPATGDAFPARNWIVEPRKPSPFPLLIGKARDGSDVRWAPYRPQPNHLNNFSFLVTGDSGSGKTQTIRVLLDAGSRQDLAITVFDFKADYCDDDFVDRLGLDVVDLRHSGLPFNPLQPPPHGASGAQPIEHAYELSAVLARVFRLGAQQESALKNAIVAAYKAAGIKPHDWIDPESQSWPTFDHVVEQLREDSRFDSIMGRLGLLSELGLFPQDTGGLPDFEAFLNGKVCLKMSDLPSDEIKAALAELLIIQLHGFALRGDPPRRLTRMLVFDEAHRVKGSQKLETLAREGRAFGIGLVIGTQFPGDIPDSLAGNLATQLFLMNNQAAHRSAIVKQMFGTTAGRDAKQLMDELGKLKPLQGLFTNAHFSSVLLDVIPYYARLET